MALVDIDTWLTEYDACERLSRNIQTQIVLRNTQPRLSADYTKISSGVRFNLKQFETNLEQLNRTLTQSAARGSITRREAERRQRQIETLQSQFVHLQTQFKEVSHNDQREELFNKTSYWQGDNEEDDDDEPLGGSILPQSSNEYKVKSVDDLRRQQSQILEHQDEGLEALSKVLSRQKNLALRIGDEVDEQNVIVDELAVTMDNTNSRIRNETQNVGFVIERDSTMCYWIIIITLFVANLIVVLLL